MTANRSEAPASVHSAALASRRIVPGRRWQRPPPRCRWPQGQGRWQLQPRGSSLLISENMLNFTTMTRQIRAVSCDLVQHIKSPLSGPEAGQNARKIVNFLIYFITTLRHSISHNHSTSFSVICVHTTSPPYALSLFLLERQKGTKSA